MGMGMWYLRRRIWLLAELSGLQLRHRELLLTSSWIVSSISTNDAYEKKSYEISKKHLERTCNTGTKQNEQELDSRLVNKISEHINIKSSVKYTIEAFMTSSKSDPALRLTPSPGSLPIGRQ